MLIDTHAHYDDVKYEEDRDACLSSLKEAGVQIVINAAQDMATTELGIQMAEKYSYIYCTAGIHPHEAEKACEEDYGRIAALSAPQHARRNRIVAIGETGLDYYYDFSPREVQKENFARHVRMALENGLPLVVHDREAHSDTLQILERENGFQTKVVFHCFSGSREFAELLARKGCYFSFGGAITFKNAKKFPEVLRAIPEDRIMLETDCPYMTPEPHRGTRNTSAYLPLVASRLAEILGKSFEETAALTTANAKRFFGI